MKLNWKPDGEGFVADGKRETYKVWPFGKGSKIEWRSSRSGTPAAPYEVHADAAGGKRRCETVEDAYFRPRRKD